MAESLGDIGLATGACCNWQRLNRLYYQVAREVTTDEANHLMIVQGSYYFIVRGRVEYFLHLLEE